MKNKVYCRLTKLTLNKDVAEMDRHITGKKYQQALTLRKARTQKREEMLQVWY